MSQKHITSLRCELESIEAQINYIDVKIRLVTEIQTADNQKNDEVINKQFEEMEKATNDSQKELIRKKYEQIHLEFCQDYLINKREKASLQSEHVILGHQKKRIEDELKFHFP